MASDQHIPPPNRSASFSARSTSPSSEEDAPPTPSKSAHRHDIESKVTSPSNVSHQSGEQKPDFHGQPPPQGGQQTLSNIPSDPAGVTGIGPSQSPQEKENHRLLGIPPYQGHSYVVRSYDYMRKYPPDAPGKELSPDARVWKVYLDESESYDNDIIRSFRDTIDSLLVFAALFSSIITGFVGQTSQALEPDYAQIGVSLLFEQIQVLRAAGNATRIQEIPRSPLTPDSITHSSLDVTINWLFFASLAFSLATAFIAVLIKQWLQAFTALIPGDAKRRSLTRQFRFTGLQKWKLPEIINVLPLFLHLALALFLIGLCLFVSQLHPSIMVMVSVVTCAAIAFYVITGALPAVRLDCPYRLPILFLLACLVDWAAKLMHFKIFSHLERLRNNPDFDPAPPLRSLSPLQSQEQAHIEEPRMTKTLEGLSLAWLFSQTLNESVQRVALHGASQLLGSETFEGLKNQFHPSMDIAISLRDSLPLQSMSKTAVRLCTPETQLEDGPLLRDLVLASRRVCGDPLLSQLEVEHVLDSPYARSFVEAQVLPTSHSDSLLTSLFTGAIHRDKWDIVMYLLNSSLDVLWDARSGGCHVLAFASVSESISHNDWVTIFSIAKQRGIGFNTFHFAANSLSTLLHIVSSYGTLSALHHLITHAHNLDFNVADRFGSTPLHLACDRGKDYPIQEATSGSSAFWILGRFAEHNKISPKKPAPLTRYVVQKLLSAGADPNIMDNEGRLPLHNACSNGFQNFGSAEASINIINELLEATANINQRSKDGFTPLDLLQKSDRKDKGEAMVGYSLMRRHGARLAKELAEVEKDEKDSPSRPF